MAEKYPRYLSPLLGSICWISSGRLDLLESRLIAGMSVAGASDGSPRESKFQ